LSSQTTDTPGTTQTHVQDRSGATFQTYPIPATNANPVPRTHTSNQTSPTRNQHATKTTISRLFTKGIRHPQEPASRQSPSRRLRKQYTHHTPTANPPQQALTSTTVAPKTPGIPGVSGGPQRLKRPLERRLGPLWSPSHFSPQTCTRLDWTFMPAPCARRESGYPGAEATGERVPAQDPKKSSGGGPGPPAPGTRISRAYPRRNCRTCLVADPKPGRTPLSVDVPEHCHESRETVPEASAGNSCSRGPAGTGAGRRSVAA
jgi:hypothetical protein